jgi:hypothetical protein
MADRQLRDRLHDSGAARGLPFMSPLLDDELPVPAEDGVGSDERSNFGEDPSSNCSSSHGKSSALGISQSNSVFLLEIFDDRVLLVGDPAGQGGHEDLPGLNDDCHPEIVAICDHDRQLSRTV